MLVIYLFLSIILIIFLTARLKIHPFISLFIVSIVYGFFAGMPFNEIVASVNEGFGSTLGKIGLIIIFGVLIGAFLENTGAAYRLAEMVLRITGKKRVPTGMGIIGYIVSIPVFADSGFLLLAPLNKSLTKRAGISLAGSGVALGLGLTATHTLVPPTPGPVAAAGILNADIGIVLLFGFFISALALIPALFFAAKYASRTYIEPDPELSESEINERLKAAPGFVKSSLPILIPIILIVVKSVLNPSPDSGNSLAKLISFIGEPVIALFIGMLLALLLPKKLNYDMLSTSGWAGKALRDSATIILITGAGGIFGKVLQNSGIAEVIGQGLSGVNLGIWLPFLLAAAIKIAQGSSTVALITTASIMTPLMSTLGFVTEIEKALVVLAIGAGSIVVSHANDSFFWVVTQMSLMDVKTGYRLYSTGTLVLGVSAALLIFTLYLIII
ncbi:MAG: gluconate:H+ symporter [Ignavibacteriaceae bacterium]